MCLGKSLAWAEMNSTLVKMVSNFEFELSGRMKEEVGDWSDTRVWLVHETKSLWVKIRRRRGGGKEG